MPVCTSNEIDCGQKSQHNIHRIGAPQFQKSKATLPNKLHSHTNITANNGFKLKRKDNCWHRDFE